MTDIRPRIRPVLGPNGVPLSVADLPPPNTGRWVMRRKAEVVAAVRGGLLSVETACGRYTLSTDEYLNWEQAIDEHGLLGLRATRLQMYRQHEPVVLPEDGGPLNQKLLEAKEVIESAQKRLELIARSQARLQSQKNDLDAEIARVEAYLTARHLPHDTDTVLVSLRSRRAHTESSLKTLAERVPEAELMLSQGRDTLKNIATVIDLAAQE